MFDNHYSPLYCVIWETVDLLLGCKLPLTPAPPPPVTAPTSDHNPLLPSQDPASRDNPCPHLNTSQPHHNPLPHPMVGHCRISVNVASVNMLCNVLD